MRRSWGWSGLHYVGGTGALGFLLVTEVVAATAVVSKPRWSTSPGCATCGSRPPPSACRPLLTVGAMLIANELGFNDG